MITAITQSRCLAMRYTQHNKENVIEQSILASLQSRCRRRCCSQSRQLSCAELQPSKMKISLRRRSSNGCGVRMRRQRRFLESARVPCPNRATTITPNQITSNSGDNNMRQGSLSPHPALGRPRKCSDDIRCLKLLLSYSIQLPTLFQLSRHHVSAAASVDECSASRRRGSAADWRGRSASSRCIANCHLTTIIMAMVRGAVSLDRTI